MKKLFILVALTGVVALASCNGNTSGRASQAGERMDSMVNAATAAVSDAADSVSKGAKKASDSAKAAIDSAVNGGR